MRKNSSIEMSVGLFLIIGLLSLTYLTLKLGNVGVFTDETYTLNARFVSSSGLKKGAFVEVGGVRVGTVQNKLRVDRRNIN
jgi:phospholipid/cholesterol/gamma-HCH transport system substrate-binding protein